MFRLRSHRTMVMRFRERSWRLLKEKSDKALIELPGEPVVGGLRAWVPKADVAYA